MSWPDDTSTSEEEEEEVLGPKLPMMDTEQGK